MSYAGGAVLWDSGKVAGNVSTNVPYGGPALKADSDYSWTVTWWDSTGAISEPATATFSTGLLSQADWQGAVYVGGANMLRAQFDIPTAVSRARLYIVGLGYYRSWINGAPTDAHVLGQFTTFQQRILYDAWDVTPSIVAGCNTLGVMLGAGWYAQPTIAAGPRSLMVLLSVTTTDGSTLYFPSSLPGALHSQAATALLFNATAGPVVADDIYAGEVYDARLEQPGWSTCAFTNGSAWAAASAVPTLPNAALSWHSVPIMVDEVYSPVAISQPVSSPDFVIDFGQNMAGQTTTNVICPNGAQWIGFLYGESLHQDGSVLNQYGSIMRANFTCAGTGDVESYTTLFSYYGFR